TDKYYKIAPFAPFIKPIQLIINDLFMVFVDQKDLHPITLITLITLITVINGIRFQKREIA
ncbi:hypothetical protein L2734_17280, partial [Parashewanella spongiae]